MDESGVYCPESGFLLALYEGYGCECSVTALNLASLLIKKNLFYLSTFIPKMGSARFAALLEYSDTGASHLKKDFILRLCI